MSAPGMKGDQNQVSKKITSNKILIDVIYMFESAYFWETELRVRFITALGEIF